jgi:hypothetical protein
MWWLNVVCMETIQHWWHCKHCSYEMITLHYWNWDLTCVQILFLFEHRSLSDCCNILCTIVRNTFSALVHNSRQIIFSQFNVCVFYVLFVVYWTVEPTTGCINCYTCTVFFFLFFCVCWNRPLHCCHSCFVLPVYVYTFIQSFCS